MSRAVTTLRSQLTQPSPAIIAQSAVRRLPGLALLLFCVAYVLPGFVGRSPWKNADIAAFGAMQAMASGHSPWLHPQLLGQTAGFEGLLPYWLGAWAIKALPFLDAAHAVRVPFVALLVLTLFAVWRAVYCLAHSPQAQPVAFAFGGEASAPDYARAVADAGLLALLASLGLAQLAHETTPALAQLGFASLAFFSMAARGHPHVQSLRKPALGWALGVAGLTLSGAPTVAALLGVGCLWVEWAHSRWGREYGVNDVPRQTKQWLIFIAATGVLMALLAYALDLWRWRVDWHHFTDPQPKEWQALAKLLLWFTWPVGPLALWTLWRWRRQMVSRHVALPLWFALVALATTVTTNSADRSLLLGLPPLAALAAFALPTLKRSMASLIEWFTLIFFTTCALSIWVIWVAMQTGVPSQPAANVAKLAPGFQASFSLFAFVAALLATLAWAWLVKWRTRKQRAALWKTLVLPAAGATLCWLLLMTLWLPLLDYARSYAPLAGQVARLVRPGACVEVAGLNSTQIAALQYHGKLQLQAANTAASPSAACPYLVLDAKSHSRKGQTVDLSRWTQVATLNRPTDKTEKIQLFKRKRNSLQAAQP